MTTLTRCSGCTASLGMHTPWCPRPDEGRSELADVRFLPWVERTFGDPTTWAWDTHSELVALWCFACAEVADGYGDRTCDNDVCQHCGSEDTSRVITNVAGHIVRGPHSIV